MKKYHTLGSRIFNFCNIVFMLLLIFITLYPIYHVVVASLSDPILLMSHTGPLFKILGKPTLVGYEKTIANKSLITGFGNTLFYVTVGTFLQVALTSFAAFVLTRKNFMIRNIMMKFMIFTMFFSGGLIPLFFAIKNTGAEIVSYGAPVLPGAMFLLSYYNGNIPIIGLPGCVMYAKRTIFDLALPRIMADDEISVEELAALGEGGLCLNCPVCTFPNCGFGK